MYTGTGNVNDVPRLVKEFLDQGFTNVEVTQNSIGQWIVRASNKTGGMLNA